MTRTLVANLTLWVAISLVALPCWGQLRVEAGNPTLEATPGDFVTVVLTVFNDTDTDERVQVSLQLPAGLSILGGITPVDVPAQASETLFLTIVVSPQATSGAQPITVLAQSTVTSGASASTTVTITVLEVPGLRLEPPPPRNVELAETVVLAFQITNEGNAMDQVLLNAEAPSNVEVELETVMVSLLPGETRTVALTATLSASITPGRLRILLTANSTVFPDVSAQTVITITVLPLRPEGVGGRLVLEVPSTLSMMARLTDVDTPAVITHSLVGGANFNRQDRVDYALVLDNFSPRTMRFELDNDALGTRLGGLTIAWGDLLSFSGNGAQLTLKQLPLLDSISLGALTQGMLPQVGAQAVLDVAGLAVTLNHLVRFNTETQRDQLSSVLLNQPLGTTLSVFSEWAASDHGGVRDLGFILGSQFELDAFSLRAETFRIGSDFVGNRPDEVGFEVVQTFTQDDTFAVSSLLRRAQHNVNQNPLLTTQTNTDWTANLRWAPDPLLPQVLFTLNFNARQGADFSETSLLTSTLRLSQLLGEHAAAGGILQHVTNLASDEASRIETLVVGLDLAFTSDPLSSLVGITQTTQLDLLAGALSFQELEAFANLQLRNELVTLGLGLSRISDSFSLDASLEARLGAWNAVARVGLDQGDDGAVALNAQAGIATGFDAPIPFIQVSGRVQGTVFIDRNGNGVQDAQEPGVGDIVLNVGSVGARTDESGAYRTPPLAPGTYEISVTQLPLSLVPLTPLPLTVEVARGQTVEVNLALTQVSGVHGVVFNDENQNGTFDEGEGGVPNVRITLIGEGASTTTLSGATGLFALSDLLPGAYTVTLDSATLPERFEPTTSPSVRVVLALGEQVQVNFGVFQRPQTIVFVPTAAFSVNPENPVAGQTVTFDASDSFDVDGQITAFSWDVDGDGQTDLEGQVVTFVYPAPGSFVVTLTVTDNDGGTDTLQKTIEVLPAN